MKQKPRWMRSVIEAAKAECAARPRARRVSAAKPHVGKAPAPEAAKA